MGSSWLRKCQGAELNCFKIGQWIILMPKAPISTADKWTYVGPRLWGVTTITIWCLTRWAGELPWQWHMLCTMHLSLWVWIQWTFELLHQALVLVQQCNERDQLYKVKTVHKEEEKYWQKVFDSKAEDNEAKTKSCHFERQPTKLVHLIIRKLGHLPSLRPLWHVLYYVWPQHPIKANVSWDGQVQSCNILLL